ncbi:MAG: NACHT domain-containing protein [Chloroflexota bacterium]
MSFRKAFLILGLAVLAIAAVVYVFQGHITLPENALEYLIIVGLIFAFIPNLKDSVEFFQGMLSPYQQRNVESPPIDPHRYEQIRRAALQNVRSSWVEGVLEKSLHQGIWLQLGLTSQPHAISRRTLRTNEQETPIAADKSIEMVFNEAGRKLLILGDPGSGKTMQLLQLAKALIATAESDPAAPLPFVFNLASWSQQREPLADWLAEELHQQYQLSRQFARQIIATKPLTLLLDGLDEVVTEHRPACLSAINVFLTNHDTDLVVCSRLKEYDTLRDKLNLSSAIRIQPLTDDQINNFLNHPGLELQAVRATLAQDSTLRELAQTPLMLHIMAVAYAGLTLTQLGHLNTTKVRQRHIFSRYVDLVLRHRPLDSNVCGYTVEQASHWINQLAIGMFTNKQSFFHIEQLQPIWLPTKIYQVITGGLFGLFWGILIGFVAWLIFDSCFAFWLGLAFAPLMFITIATQDEANISPTEKITWERLQHFPTLIFFSLALSGLGLLFGLSGWLLMEASMRLVGGFNFGPLFGLRGWLTLGLFLGLLSGVVMYAEIDKIEERLQPNQGIINSRNNSLKMTWILGLLCGSLGGLLSVLFKSSIEITAGAGSGFLIGGAIGMLLYGATAVIQHYTLRYLLARANILPFPFSDKKLIAFLDDMADRLILRRVGGGWIFIHRTLLEYFAEQANFTQQEQVQAQQLSQIH